MSAIASPFFPWVGGKERLAPYIFQVLPPKTSQHLEPFGGGAAVLLGLPKDPSRLDIYNDLNGDLVNLMVCTRDMPLALLKELDFIPIHARSEFNDLKELLAHESLSQEELDAWKEEEIIAEAYFSPEEAAELKTILQQNHRLWDVQRAAAFYKVSRGSFSGTRTSFGVKKNNIRRFRYQIQLASIRLQDVVIENRDAISLIPERDCPTGLIYNDPPYYEAERLYEAQFTKQDHVRLYHALRACKGYVVVSYNDCPYIRNLYKDFFILTIRRNNPMTKKKGAEYGELIITNYDPRPYMSRQINLFETPGEKGVLELVRIPRTPLKVA